MMDMPTSRSTKSSEWDDAWDLVRRLSAARGSLSAGATHGTQAGLSVRPLPEAENHNALSMTVAAAATPVADELMRAIADIERASAALRRAEPALEAGLERVRPTNPTANTSSLLAWIGLLWIATVGVTAGAIFTIAWLVS